MIKEKLKKLKNKFYSMKDETFIYILVIIGILMCLIIGLTYTGNNNNNVTNENKSSLKCGWVFGEGIKCGVGF